MSNHPVRQTKTLRDFLIRPLDFLFENLDRVGFIDWREVFPLEVFDQLFASAIDGIRWPYQTRNFIETRELTCAPASLASDDSVRIHTREWHDGDWVEHPVLAQGIRKPSKSGFIKNLPGLIRVLDDFIDSDAA
jgi:hypothetical protein